MNGIQVTKVGIVSCSGEEIPNGTLCRMACRRVLDAASYFELLKQKVAVEAKKLYGQS